MTFAALNAAVVDLRNSLRSFVGEDAVSEITVRPPVGEGDEISFLRLVAWSYVLVFEAGRVTIPYLLQLPEGISGTSSDPKAARDLVHALRTWSFHNLGFGSDQDVAISRHVQLWFVRTCGACPPDGVEAWRSCSLTLCSEVGEIVAHCQNAMTSVLSAPDDGQAATADLRRRINRAWAAHEFHKLVGDAAIRLGITVDAKTFCAPRLRKWQEFLESLPDRDDPEGHMIRMIERDLLDHFADVLPIDGRDVMNALGLDPGPEVGSALHRTRELFRSGVRDPTKLLEYLKKNGASVME